MIGSIKFSSFYQQYMPEFQQALEEFLNSGYYIGGPLLEDFEDRVRRFIGAEYAVGCKSGTSALQLALAAAGIGPGDEVITVANTYYATAWSIVSLGAKPVFCDVNPVDGLLDPDKIEACINRRTRAILPVHLYGFSVRADRIRQLAATHNLTIIEDCAHSFGSAYQGRLIGADSEFACLSFYPTKNLGAFGDAGMVLTNSSAHAQRMRELRYFASDDRTTFLPHGLHARLDPLQARLLSVELDHFDEIDRRRKHLATIYRTALCEHARCVPEDTERTVTPYVFPIFVADREALLAYLKEQDIGVQVHYSTNLDQLPEFRGATPWELPHTHRHNAEVLTLPVHPSITDDEARVMCDAIVQFLEGEKQ